MQFTINIAIGTTGLSRIYGAGQSVTFVRQVNAFAMSPAAMVRSNAIPYSVAWLAFPPYPTNIVTWTDACNLFASTTVAEINNVITVNATTASAAPGQMWTFANGQFSLASTGGGSAYKATNLAANGLSFGLQAVATVNGAAAASPLSLQPVLFNQALQITPSERVSIFLSSASASGTIIPPAGGLTVTAGSTPIAVGFNDATNQFYLTG